MYNNATPTRPGSMGNYQQRDFLTGSTDSLQKQENKQWRKNAHEIEQESQTKAREALEQIISNPNQSSEEDKLCSAIDMLKRVGKTKSLLD